MTTSLKWTSKSTSIVPDGPLNPLIATGFGLIWSIDMIRGAIVKASAGFVATGNPDKGKPPGPTTPLPLATLNPSAPPAIPG